MKQKRLKKEELKLLYSKGNKTDEYKENKKDSSNNINIFNENENDFIEEKKEVIQIEFSNGEIIKETFNCRQILKDIYLFVG